MNNLIHLIWQIVGNYKPSEIWRQLFEKTAKAFIADLMENNIVLLKSCKSSQSDRFYHFWKRNPLAIELFTVAVFEQKMNYIHMNPVNADLCAFADEYAFSSPMYYLIGNGKFGIVSNTYN